MAPSKAHAVQTSAHASVPVELDMFAAEEAANERMVTALQYTGTILADATAAMAVIGPENNQAPVVSFEMECEIGAVTFVAPIRMVFPTDGRIAAQAKANHCRKGARVEVDASFVEVRLVLPFCNAIRVIEEAAR